MFKILPWLLPPLFQLARLINHTFFLIASGRKIENLILNTNLTSKYTDEFILIDTSNTFNKQNNSHYPSSFITRLPVGLLGRRRQGIFISNIQKKLFDVPLIIPKVPPIHHLNARSW
ncbi:uncharacterized protein BDR25DRAFT_361216 [Lindgomyces ingoldianus]|uniref:Uncharacterized protein n=1 Tax=Lindgomyces ingoldianus TaxID=673940 RepID=A0ACB6QC94_9PLEO|nr:uncharacterized protein BDR25DRAFT_361216 [Lindgomyces ingoldianus]KAF2464669.1 hypothetical protein BDR25DRAFT_361216 [Lindgomyces ingoldianus]